jgi:eukaryotic-like serine/threonine-protein kinase
MAQESTPQPLEGVGSRSWPFRGFISYSHSDKKIAEWLHRRLETYRVPHRLVGVATSTGTVGKKLGRFFRDRDELSVSADLSGKINEAIAGSQFLIVVCSPASARSRWVNQEIINFKRLRGSDSIIAIISDGEPFSSVAHATSEIECFPEALRFVVDSDGHVTDQQAEPIAADFRKNKDGRSLGTLKIISGILGVSLDNLVQRENIRRQRQTYAIAAASISLALIMTYLASVAVQGRDASWRRSVAWMP